MPITLKNRDLALTVESAGEKYRGSRFDWNGFVSQARFRGVTLLGQEKPFLQRNPALFGRGLHNEFGIKKCIGYDDCAVGEWFPKIGTGWLKKDEKPYFFYTQYPLEPLSFECDAVGKTEASFVCESGERNGYAYRYVKRISLEDSTFRIRYELRNAGSKPIETDEYVHNFLCIGGRRMDEGYSLSFPWKLDPAHFVETSNPDGILVPTGNRMDVVDQTDSQFYFGGLSEGVSPDDGLCASWTLSDSRRKISLSEKSPFIPSGVHVWGWTRVISPEVFFPFRVEPGATVSWERVYTASSL
jgi:hypothetical protein